MQYTETKAHSPQIFPWYPWLLHMLWFSLLTTHQPLCTIWFQFTLSHACLSPPAYSNPIFKNLFNSILLSPIWFPFLFVPFNSDTPFSYPFITYSIKSLTLHFILKHFTSNTSTLLHTLSLIVHASHPQSIIGMTITLTIPIFALPNNDLYFHTFFILPPHPSHDSLLLP